MKMCFHCRFCSTLEQIRNRHSDVVQTMAQGVIELKVTEGGTVDSSMENSIQYFLDRLYMSRISIRMLINQHSKSPPFVLKMCNLYSKYELLNAALLFGQSPNDPGRHIGCLDPACKLSSVVRDAYENARFLCDQYYLISPELQIEEHNELEDATMPIRTVYVPSHLYHMLFEIFKNSMRAVVESKDNEKCDKLPPLKVLIVRGKEDICVKASERQFYV